MKILKIMLPLILAATLAVSIGLPGVSAQEPEETQEDVPPAWGRELPRLLRGKVAGIDEGGAYFVIQHGENVTREVAVDNGTKYYIVRAPKLAGLLRGQEKLKPANEAEASGIKPAGPVNLGQLIRQRVALKQQNNEAATDDVKPANPRKPRLINAASLRKINGSDRLVSTPTASPEPVPVNGEDEEADAKGWGKWQRYLRFAQKAAFDDLEVGDRVVVRLVPGQNKSVARQVLIFKPSPNKYKKVAGTITAVSSDNQSITIAPANNGEPVTLSYNQDTIFNLKGFIAVVPGQLARAVYHAEDMMARQVAVRLPGDTESAESSD